MAHSSIRPKVRRRKVANLAAYSRQHTVRNYTISSKKDIFVEWKDGKLYERTYNITKDKDGKDLKEEVHTLYTPNYSWKNPKEGYPQPKGLRKRCKGQKWVKYKDGTVELKKWDYPSEFPDAHAHEKKLWKNLGKAAKMKAYEDEKMKKWERKHPKPCPTDDLFKDEYIPLWEKEREEALIRIRDFVVSMFDKLPLTGRYKTGEHKFEEKQIAEIKDINGEGHKVNELKKDSKLLKHAQKKVNEASAKSEKFVAGNLRDHKRKKGRIILPERKAA